MSKRLNVWKIHVKKRPAYILIFLFMIFQPRCTLGQEWNDLIDRADSLFQLNKYDSAIIIGEKAIESVKAKPGGSDSSLAKVLSRVAEFYYATTAYEKAENYLRQVLKLQEHLYGSEHADIVATVSRLGAINSILGRYQEAESLFKRAYSIRKKYLKPDHPDIGRSLNNLAIIYFRTGQFVRAESLYVQVQEIFEKNYGADHELVAKVMDNLASVYLELGKYYESEKLCLRALEIKEQILGRLDLSLAQTYNNLGGVYLMIGRLNEAESSYKRAVEILSNKFGPDYSGIGTISQNLAFLYSERCEYVRAEALYLKSLEINEKILGREHPEVATYLKNLASLYKSLQKYAESESLYRRAILIREKAFGPDNSSVASGFTSLADLYLIQGKTDSAEIYFTKAFDILVKSLGRNHPDVATSLRSRAGYHYYLGNFKTAESLLEQSLEICKKVFPEMHPQIGQTLFELANVYLKQGRLNYAHDYYSRAQEIFKACFGENHSHYAQCLVQMCRLYRLQNRLESAVESGYRACLIRLKNVTDNSRILSEQDALNYSQLMKNAVDIYLSAFINSMKADRKSIIRAADIIFASKGNVSDGIFERQRRLVNEKDTVILNLAETLRYTKYRLSKFFIEGSADYTDQYMEITDSLRRLANDLETELSRRSLSYRRAAEINAVSSDRILKNMPDDAAHIEFLKYNYYEPESDSTTPHYLAVVAADDTDPLIVDLGAASEIDALIRKYRRHLLRVSSRGVATDPDQVEYDSICGELYRVLLGPIEKLILGRDFLLIAPDGLINLVSFAGLKDDHGKYLVERFAMQYLLSGRDLIRLETVSSGGEGLLALGDPDFDASLSGTRSDKSKAGGIKQPVDGHAAKLIDSPLNPLPGTRREIELIIAKWKKSFNEPFKVLLRSEASESRFKAEVSGKRIIHLATHGYYLDPQDRAGFRSDMVGPEADFAGENPLLYAGLFLAGANNYAGAGNDDDLEDGILTAYEVSSMNLDGTDLVVLSACETGLGVIETGEGVYGLRRAFQLAGARTVISALWSISDIQTVNILSNLYQRDGVLPEILRQAQLMRIDHLRGQGKPDHPYDWASFIIIGDWR